MKAAIFLGFGWRYGTSDSDSKQMNKIINYVAKKVHNRTELGYAYGMVSRFRGMTCSIYELSERNSPFRVLLLDSDHTLI